MPRPYYEPQSIAPILQRGLEQQAPYLAQPKGGMVAALGPLGDLAKTAFATDIEGTKRRSLLAQQQAYANYLAKVDSGTATPDDHKTGTIAALSLGLKPPSTGRVAPDIWGAIQKEGQFTTSAPGTKENVQAGETLARLKGNTKEANKKIIEENKQKATDEKFWSSNFKLFTPTNAPRGSLIGQAAYGNARADRALKMLDRSGGKITPQDLNKVIVDLAGIMQGGSPHTEAVASQGYNTLSEQWAALKTRISGTPNAANIPDIVNDLRKVVSEIKDVDNLIIQDNLNTFEATNSEQIGRNPGKWNKIRASVTRGAMPTTPPPAAPGSSSVTDYIKGLNLSGPAK